MENMNQSPQTALPENSFILNTAVPSAQTVPSKNKWDLKPHDMVFAFITMILGFLFARWVIIYADGFQTTGFFLLLYLCGEIFIRRSGCKPKLTHHILGAVLCGFTLIFSLTASILLHGLTFVFLCCGMTWRIHAVCSDTGFVTRYFPFDLWECISEEPFRHFDACPKALAMAVRKSSTANAVKTVLLGLLVTVPLTAVVAGLLASADSGIENLLNSALDLLTSNVMTTIMELVIGIPISFWLFGTMFSAVQRKLHPNPMTADEIYEQKLAGLRIFPNLGLYAGVTPICLLYLVYVISQMNYFLSAFAGRLPDGMSYSEYARRGFFELCAIAVINLIVLLVLTGCAKKGGKDRPKALTVYAVILCLFTLFIIATALAKMVLYINAYGLTSLRLYTAWFMVLLCIVFLVLLARQFLHKLPTAAVLTAAFIVMFGGLCFSRPDAVIAEYNITRYEQGTLSQFDANALYKLSADAYVVMLNHKDTLAETGQWEYFCDKTDNLQRIYQNDKGWSWNLSAQILLQKLHTDTSK